MFFEEMISAVTCYAAALDDSEYSSEDSFWGRAQAQMKDILERQTKHNLLRNWQLKMKIQRQILRSERRHEEWEAARKEAQAKHEKVIAGLKARAMDGYRQTMLRQEQESKQAEPSQNEQCIAKQGEQIGQIRSSALVDAQSGPSKGKVARDKSNRSRPYNLRPRQRS